MEIITILAFIALIAVIFGVSMHEAFWGIIIFIILALLAGTIIFFIKSAGEGVSKKINYMKTPQGKKELEKKKNDFIGELIVIFILLIIASPILIIIIFHTTALKEFAEENEKAVFAMAFAPLTIFVITELILLFKKYLSKKRTK